MTEPRNKHANKKLEATCEGPGDVKKLNIASLNKKWGALGPESDDKKKESANGPNPTQEAEQYDDEMDLSKVDNYNKTVVNPAYEPKKEAADKFKTGELKNIDSLNRKEWGYTGPASDDKKKAGAGKDGVF